MTTTTDLTESPDAEYVLLCGVSWEAYERILEALNECHPRHSYDRGTLEMRRVLYGVAPESYRAFIDALSDHYVRHTYDGWTLEMMTPRFDHEWVKGMLGRMLEAMALSLDIPVQSAGSTTLSTAKGGRGLQPDESYYIGERVLARSQGTYRPGVDPPPDLAIEVDVTNTMIPRLPLYAEVGVRELWRHADDKIQFYVLKKKHKYVEIERSLAFPFVTPQDIARFLDQRDAKTDNAIIRAFVRWVKRAQREQRATE